MDALAADAAFVVEQLGLSQVVVVGQSMGGMVAMLLAARRPELVAGLVVVEADPDEGSPDTAAEVGAWLRHGRRRSARARTQCASSAARLDLPARGRAVSTNGPMAWPAFDPDVLGAMLDDALGRELPVDLAERMAASLNASTVVEIEDAGRDPHLDQPEGWQAALNPFVARVATPNR